MHNLSIKKAGHLVAIGAGDGSNLARLVSERYTGVHIYEADFSYATELKKQFSQINTSVHHALVDSSCCLATFYCFKPKSFNALASALPVINSSLPGIKCVHKMQMQTEDIAGIIGKLALDKDNNTLLLEVPAQNLQLLIHLKNNKLLEKFSSVVIQHSKEQIYEGSATLTALQRFMEEQGYELNGPDSSDSAHITLHYYRDAQAIELLMLQEQLAVLRNAAEQLELVTQQALSEKKHFEQQAAELNQQLVSARHNALAEKQQLEQQITDLSQQLATVKQQSQVEKQKFEQEKTELTLSLEQKNELNQKHKAWAESLSSQNEQLAKELKEQQRSSQLSIKLLAKSEADTTELRGRYAELYKTEQELRNLVGELYIKLSAASKFYDKLEKEHPELLENKHSL